MEETSTNVQLEVNELHHHNITPNQSICKEIKNVAVIAEEITENPEYVVMHRSIAVQAIANEEVVIPKQDLAPNQRSHLTVVCSEGGSTMEMDISSQESAMDIASQESLPVKDSNSEEPQYCDHRVSVSFREEAVLARELDVQKREEAVLECEKKLRNQEEKIAEREKTVFQTEMEIHERRETLNIQAKQIADWEISLKKREAAVQIRELEADGYQVILQSCNCNGNGSLPAKRSKKN